jgi:hypothetical protein
MNESDTRLIPYSDAEVKWARHRPPEHRTPLPHPGTDILYRHDSWGPLISATVEAILYDPDDPDVGMIGGRPNPDVWEAQSDPVTGHYLMVHGHTITVAKPDPWPQMVLITQLRPMRVTTQEARLRGSAGWLPLDWETRTRYMPGMIEIGRR